jgi:hypothetical protein
MGTKCLADDIRLKKLGRLGTLRDDFGTGVLSQNVSGTKKNRRIPQKPTTMATILEGIRKI